MKSNLILFICLVYLLFFSFYCTTNPKVQIERPILPIYKNYEKLIADVVKSVINYAEKNNEKGMKFLLIIDPTMINKNPHFYKDTTWTAFNSVDENAYKFAIPPKKLKEVLKYIWYANDEALYKAIETQLDKSAFPDRIIKIERLESQKSLTFSILRTRERTPVENLKQKNYMATFKIFGEFREYMSLNQKITSYLGENNVNHEWQGINPGFHKKDISPDKYGNYFYKLIFEKKIRKEIEQYKFKLLVIFELSKDRTNISSVFWHSPKYKLLDSVPLNDEYSYLYLYFCFDAPDTFQWSSGWDPKNMREGIVYPKGNYLKKFVYDVIKKLPKKGVVTYAIRH